MFKKRKKRERVIRSGDTEIESTVVSSSGDAASGIRKDVAGTHGEEVDERLRLSLNSRTNKSERNSVKFIVSTSLKSSKHKDVDTIHYYESSRSAAPAEYSGGATATSEIDGVETDGKAVGGGDEEDQGSLVGDKTYRGKAGYTKFLSSDKSNKIAGIKGPVRAPANLRSTSRFDYQPDICKDYKETGYCGYGDNCKFLHDRGNYKAGWEIEKEWQAEQKLKKQKLASGEESERVSSSSKNPEDAERPFACHICRKPFVKPVQTACKHYFCQKCALEHYAKSSKCAVCGKPTRGIFNSAEFD